MKKFTKTHEWLESHDRDDTYKIGITEHAQGLLGDVVFVELPEEGRKVSAGDEIVVVESVKAASSVYSPVSGEVIGVNSNLEDSPETINASAEEEGWLVEIAPSNFDEESGNLLDKPAYDAIIKDSDEKKG